VATLFYWMSRRKWRALRTPPLFGRIAVLGMIRLCKPVDVHVPVCLLHNEVDNAGEAQRRESERQSYELCI
jgi:hypothetical protein